MVFDNTQAKLTKFSGMLGEDEKNNPKKKLFNKFKQRSSKLINGFPQDLVKHVDHVGFLFV